MGNSLARPRLGFDVESPGDLPNPTRPEVISEFKACSFMQVNIGEDGVKRASELEYGTKREGVMGRYVVPMGWGMITDSDRGDMLYAHLVDTNGWSRFEISWMSKGSYDNQASIEVVRPEDRREVNMEVYVLDAGRGQYKLGPQFKDHIKYVDKANRYAESQYRGAHQSDLDADHDKLVGLWREGFPKIQKLTAQERGNMRDVATACAIAFANPYSYPNTKMWIKKEKETETAVGPSAMDPSSQDGGDSDEDSSGSD